MSKMFTGSICLTDLMDAAHDKNEAFTRAKNQKVYANVVIWANDKKDEYGNDMSIKLNPPKDSTSPSIYVGNAKSRDVTVNTNQQTPAPARQDGLPF